MVSHTEENYLKAIYKISEYERDVASTNLISKEISTTPASVTDMLKRLSDKKLINYQKYKGVTLTNEGNALATGLIRRHRLWESFLVNTLDFNWDEVHELAEELEHVGSKKMIDKLEAFLGYPKFDPHGDPIPSADGKFTLRNQIRLSELQEGETATVLGVRVHDKPFLDHLTELNIALGTKLKIIRRFDFDLSMMVELENKSQIKLTNKVCKNLWMKKNTK